VAVSLTLLLAAAVPVRATTTELRKWVAGAAALAIIVTLVAVHDTLHDISVRANEEQALQDILDFARTENEYAMGTGGYGIPEMLPTRRFTWPVRNGYRFVLRADDPGVALATPGAAFLTYRYVAYPVMEDAPGAPSYFYDNQHGTIHSRTDGLEPSGQDEVVWPASAARPAESSQ
jgi:hypothetical protein